MYNRLVRASKKMYYSEKIDSLKHDPKSLWKTINEAIKRKQSKNSSIYSILVNNLKILNPTEMANGFNDFFSNIAGNINNSIPKTLVLLEFYLKNHPDINFEFGLLSNINCDSLYCLTVADVAFNSFWDSFNTVFELHFPFCVSRALVRSMSDLISFLFSLTVTSRSSIDFCILRISPKT